MVWRQPKGEEVKKYYNMPEPLVRDKYKGCGNGQIKVALDGDIVVDMNYLDGEGHIMYEQNVAMHPDAGEELFRNSRFVIYRANFSCTQACLF
jgi:hypothetical protein